MITPIFRLDQNDDHLLVVLKVPNCQLADAEVFYEATEFIFYANPYYLRLILPGEVLPSEVAHFSAKEEKEAGKEKKEEESAEQDKGSVKQETDMKVLKRKEVSYDHTTHMLTVPVPKKNKGEHFADLEMVTKFLAQPKAKTNRKLVELLESGQEAEIDLEAEELEDFDWQIEQRMPDPEQDGSSLLQGEPYGFASSYMGVLEKLGGDFEEVVDVRQPGRKSATERRAERIKREKEDFSEGHYLADLYEQPEVLDELCDTPGPWDKWTVGNILTDADRQRMIDQIPRRDFLPKDKANRKVLMLSLIDILYAYCYDMRTNDFEHTVESSWTLRKLSPTLSWLESWAPLPPVENDIDFPSHDPSYVLATCVRRALAYPLYRHWRLATRVALDVSTIFAKGRNAVLKCLLDIHKVFNEAGDNCYVMNDLYISDYCEWVSKCCGSDRSFESLSNYLSRLMCTDSAIRGGDRITKDCVKLGLELLEEAARLAVYQAQDISARGDVEHIRVVLKECDLDARTVDSDDDE